MKCMWWYAAWRRDQLSTLQATWKTLHYITGDGGGGRSPLLSAAPPPPPPALTHFAAGLEGKKVLCNRLPLYCKSHPSFFGKGSGGWHTELARPAGTGNDATAENQTHCGLLGKRGPSSGKLTPVKNIWAAKRMDDLLLETCARARNMLFLPHSSADETNLKWWGREKWHGPAQRGILAHICGDIINHEYKVVKKGLKVLRVSLFHGAAIGGVAMLRTAQRRGSAASCASFPCVFLRNPPVM